MPFQEYHDLGARMTAYFLTLIGYETFFIGANTPSKDALGAVSVIKPDLVCISVTNYFHLTQLKKLLKMLENTKALLGFATVVGGYAIDHTPHAKDSISVDYFDHSFEDLINIKEATS